MKKIVCLFTAVVMLLALCACGSKPAETTNSGSPTDIEIPVLSPSGEPQPVTSLTVCGVALVKEGQLTGMGYKGASYDNGVLTLEDVVLAPENSNYALYFSGDLEIVLKGANAIASKQSGDLVAAIYADDIRDEEGKSTGSSNLTISGDGDLTVTAEGGTESDGIWCTGSITVTGGNLDITGATHAVHDEAELVTDGMNVLENTATHLVIGAANV